MSLYTFVHIKTSSPCFPSHCLVVARRLLTGLQRDDVDTWERETGLEPATACLEGRNSTKKNALEIRKKQDIVYG